MTDIPIRSAGALHEIVVQALCEPASDVDDMARAVLSALREAGRRAMGELGIAPEQRLKLLVQEQEIIIEQLTRERDTLRAVLVELTDRPRRMVDSPDWWGRVCAALEQKT